MCPRKPYFSARKRHFPAGKCIFCRKMHVLQENTFSCRKSICSPLHSGGLRIMNCSLFPDEHYGYIKHEHAYFPGFRGEHINFSVRSTGRLSRGQPDPHQSRKFVFVCLSSSDFRNSNVILFLVTRLFSSRTKGVLTKGVSTKRSNFPNLRAFYKVVSMRNFQKSPP